jgi:GNAT superfamily N-acetyltransferase
MAGLARTFLGLSSFGRWFGVDREAIELCIAATLGEPEAEGVGFVLEVDGVIRGAVFGAVATPWFERFASHPARVLAEMGWWVDPDARGKGIELMRMFIAHGKDLGLPTTGSDLEVVGIDSAAPLFERLGFDLIERSWIKGAS